MSDSDESESSNEAAALAVEDSNLSEEEEEFGFTGWKLDEWEWEDGFWDEEAPAATGQQGSAFVHQGHDQSPMKTTSRTPAGSCIRPPFVRSNSATKDRSVEGGYLRKWVEDGAASGNISEEYQSIPQLHGDMIKSWIDFRLSADPVATAAGSNPASVGDGSGGQACDDALPDGPIPPGTEEQHQPEPSKKKVRQCEHRVGQVPTLAEGSKMGFMLEANTVEDLEQLMRSHQSRQGTCCVLFGGDRVRAGKGSDQMTTSAKWVCKFDVMLFAQSLYPAESGRAESLLQKAMKGKDAFTNFVQFLYRNPTTTCGFILQAQLMTVDQRKNFSYRDTPAAKDVTAWLHEYSDRVEGHSAHKQRLRCLATGGTSSEHSWPHRGFSGDLGSDDKKAYVTMYAAHRCFQPDLLDTGGDSASVSESAGLSLTSATALQEQMKRKTNCHPGARSIAYALQLSEPSEMMQKMSVTLLSEKLASYGPTNPSLAKQVRRYLVGGKPVDEFALNNLLQGAIAQARDDGDYAELIEATAQEVRDRMYEIAEARYKKHWKRACNGRKAKMPPFNLSPEDMPDVRDVDDDGSPISYLLGWCLAPGYVRKGIGKGVFCKFSAIDCAFAKRQGQGTFYLEAILGGDRSIHIAFVMQLLATECDFGVNLHHKHTLVAYDDKFNSKDFVCGTDGGISLINGLHKHRSDAYPIRDYRHLLLDITSPRARKVMAQIHDLPPSRKADIEEILSVLKRDDKDTFNALTHVPLHQWCRAFMPTEAYHHGNKVTSCVEVAAMMIKPARQQTTLAAAFIEIKAFIRMRWIHIYQLMSSFGRPVSVRIEKIEREAFQRATQRKTYIDFNSMPEPLTAMKIFANPMLLNQPIKVLCERRGSIQILERVADSDHRRAWDFINGNADQVLQSHTVRLSCIKAGDWFHLCSCGRNGTEVQFCPEVTYVLETFDLTSFLRKPWTTIPACKEQLGLSMPMDVTYAEVSAKMRTLHLHNYTQPRIPDAHRGGRPSASAGDDRMQPMEEVVKGAKKMMKDAAQHSGSHHIPRVPNQMQQKGLAPSSAEVEQHAPIEKGTGLDGSKKPVGWVAVSPIQNGKSTAARASVGGASASASARTLAHASAPVTNDKAPSSARAPHGKAPTSALAPASVPVRATWQQVTNSPQTNVPVLAGGASAGSSAHAVEESASISSYGLAPRGIALVPPYNTRVIAAQGSVINFTGSAIVNAANEGCISGGGVDGAVSDKGGDALHSARLALPIVRKPSVRCPTGDAKMTIGGELLCEWCIHAVGPNYNDVADDEGDLLLYMAYHASMREARKKACRTLAFSLLSAGIFRGRRALHTVIAIGVLAVHAALYEGLSDVFLVGFTHSDCETLTSVIDKLLVQPDAEDSRKQLLSQLSPRLQELHQRTLDCTLNPSSQIGVMRSTLAAASVAASKGTAPASATASAPTSKGTAPASTTATFSMLGNSEPGQSVSAKTSFQVREKVEEGEEAAVEADELPEASAAEEELPEALTTAEEAPSVALDAGGSGTAAVVSGKHDELPREREVDEQLKLQRGIGDDQSRRTLQNCMPVEYLNAHVTISSSRVTKSGTIAHATHVYVLGFTWEQTYYAFISNLFTEMLDSDSTSVKQLASLPRDDFMTTLRWDGCRPITRAHSTLTMSDALQPLDDDHVDVILEDQCFYVEIRQPSAIPPSQCCSGDESMGVANPTLPNVAAATRFFESDDLVLDVLHKGMPWYLPDNVRALVAFSATCKGAQRIVAQLASGAKLHLRHLPLPYFPLPMPPAQDEFSKQWNPSEMDEWLQPWNGEFRRGFNDRDVSNGNIPLYVNDVDRLLEGGWLSDEIINGFMTLLSTSADLGTCERRPYFAHTNFWSHAQDGWKYVARRFRLMRGAVATTRADGSIRPARLPTKISTFYIPLHVDRSHWVGAKIELVRLPTKTPGVQGLHMKLVGMDSMSTSMRTEYRELYKVLFLGFKSEWEEHGANSFLDGPIEGTLQDAAQHIRILDRGQAPPQRNGVDCGMFVIRWMEADSLGLPCNYTQVDMPHFRRLTFAELCHHSIIRRVLQGIGTANVSQLPVQEQADFAKQYPLATKFKAMMTRVTLSSASQPVIHASASLKVPLKVPGEASSIEPVQATPTAGSDQLSAEETNERNERGGPAEAAKAGDLGSTGSNLEDVGVTEKVAITPAPKPDLTSAGHHPEVSDPPPRRRRTAERTVDEVQIEGSDEEAKVRHAQLMAPPSPDEKMPTVAGAKSGVKSEAEVDREVLAEDVQGTMAAAVPTMSTRKLTSVDAMATPSITAEELMKRHMLHLGSLYPSADFQAIRGFGDGDVPSFIKGIWSSDAVNRRVPPFDAWLRPDELPETLLGAIVYFGVVEGVMSPIHAAMESEALRHNGHRGEWGLYPCLPHDRKDGTIPFGQMMGDRVRGGPFLSGSEEIKKAVENAASSFLWELRDSSSKQKKETVHLMDATSMDRGSVKCINDARGLNLPNGKKAKNNVTMEPDGTISINSTTKLSSLTQQGRPCLSEIEYFMDYGDAYFHKEPAQPVSIVGVSTRASRSEKRGERQTGAPVAPVAKKAKGKKTAALSEDSMIVPPNLRSDYAKNLSKELGHEVIHIKKDHNCLFRALAYLRDGNDLAYKDVRQLVCDELEADVGQRYSGSFTSGEGEFLNDVSYPAYVERMRHVNEWGGDLELTAFAFKFGLKIHIHHLFNKTLVIQAPSEEELSDEKHVHLAYYGDHYDVVSRMPGSSESHLGKRKKNEEDEGDPGGSVKRDQGGSGVSAGSNGDVDDGDANPRRWQARGQSKTGHRISSTEEDLKSKARLPGLGLSKTTI